MLCVSIIVLKYNSSGKYLGANSRNTSKSGLGIATSMSSSHGINPLCLTAHQKTASANKPGQLILVANSYKFFKYFKFFLLQST